MGTNRKVCKAADEPLIIDGNLVVTNLFGRESGEGDGSLCSGCESEVIVGVQSSEEAR